MREILPTPSDQQNETQRLGYMGLPFSRDLKSRKSPECSLPGLWELDPRKIDVEAELALQGLGGPVRSAETYMHLSTEKIETAQALGRAVVGGPLGDYGVTLKDMHLVGTDRYYIDNRRGVSIGRHYGKNAPKYFLVYTGDGLHLDETRGQNRSFDRIMSPKNDDLLKVRVDGVEYDTRSGMTSEAYRAMAYHCLSHDYYDDRMIPPDSDIDHGRSGQAVTNTWLTGEAKLGENRAQMGYMHAGRPVIGEAPSFSGDWRLCFRPAVQVG